MKMGEMPGFYFYIGLISRRFLRGAGASDMACDDAAFAGVFLLTSISHAFREIEIGVVDRLCFTLASI